MPATLRILMIDDCADDYDLLRISCQSLRLPHDLSHRSSGEAGIETLRAAIGRDEIPDLLLLDMDLPSMAGDEILAIIRAEPRLAAMPVVMLTGSMAPEDQAACAAADRYMLKPQGLSGWQKLALELNAFTAGGTEVRSSAARRAVARVVHVLHVDDDADDRALFARAFAKSGLGAVLHSFAGAADTLLYLNRLGPHADAERPRLIILDLSLPRLDGRALLELLKTNSRFKSIPVIVLTGSEDYADMKRCRELGIDDYVVKPRTAQELIEMIASFDHWLVGSSHGSPVPPSFP